MARYPRQFIRSCRDRFPLARERRASFEEVAEQVDDEYNRVRHKSPVRGCTSSPSLAEGTELMTEWRQCLDTGPQLHATRSGGRPP